MLFFNFSLYHLSDITCVNSTCNTNIARKANSASYFSLILPSSVSLSKFPDFSALRNCEYQFIISFAFKFICPTYFMASNFLIKYKFNFIINEVCYIIDSKVLYRKTSLTISTSISNYWFFPTCDLNPI